MLLADFFLGKLAYSASLVALAAVSTILVNFLMSLHMLLSVISLVELPPWPFAMTAEESRKVRKSDWSCMVIVI